MMKKVLAIVMTALCVTISGCGSRGSYDARYAQQRDIAEQYEALKEKTSDIGGQSSSDEPSQKEGFESSYVTEGELYDAIIAVAPSVELKDVTKTSTGVRMLCITISTDQETLIKNTDEFVSSMKAIRDQCQTAIIDNGYKKVHFYHTILDDENNNNVLFVFNKQGSDLVLEDNDYLKLTAITYPEYAEALMTSLNDWISD